MKISKNRALALFGLTLLITSLLLVNMNTPVSAQEPDIYLHGPSLVPIHMHGPSLEPVHMHCQYGIIDLLYPWETLWHQLYPDFCEEWMFTSWENNGEEYLDAGDQIDMTNTATMETRWYHVDRVTMTMRLYTEVPFPETIYVEYKGPYDPYIQPVCTNWTEVYPVYLGVTGGPYHIIDWMDNGNGYLDVCDSIVFEDWPATWWHVEEYATDLILNEKVMDPIGIWWHELYPSYCNWHELTSWEEPFEDLYPGRLSPGDQIDMINETSGITKWYFVDRVTFTMLVSPLEVGEWMYIEYKGPFDDYGIKTNPSYTRWHEVYPSYSHVYEIMAWEDNCNGVLNYCDNIELYNETSGAYSWWHVEELAIDIILNEKIEDPTCTYWHELYPECCVNDYHIEDWEDNGDKLLSPCDNVTMALMPTGPTDDYHVEEVTLTLNLTILDWMGPPPLEDRIYIEYIGGYENMYYAKIYPLDTEWHEVCPEFSELFYLTYWEDNCNGVLSYCDEIELYNEQWEQYLWCHVDEVAVDMTVKKITVELVHDVAVTNVSPLFTSVHQGWPCPITVTVQNQGDFTETFDVDCKYAGSHVTTSPITVNSLPSGGTTALTFCWVTKNVSLSTYTISAYAHQVPGETDLADNTLSDGTVQILAPHPPGFYWKEGFCDYAPSGMPDFDERQDAWNIPNGWTWCSPTATGNSLWWLDSKFEPSQPPVLPPTISDGFPLVTSYNPGVWDDHAPQNVQPFIQHLAYLMDTDGQRTHQAHLGTFVNDQEAGIAQYLSWTGVNPLGDVNGDGVVDSTDETIVLNAMGSVPGAGNWDMAADIDPVTLGWPGWGPANNVIDPGDLALVQANLGFTGMFYEHTVPAPDFYLVEEEVERSQDVVLSIGFWLFDGVEWVYREELGHSVTVAGVNSMDLKIAISDPMYDAFENQLIPEGRVPIPHVHIGPEPPYITHNDAALVSHDIYDVVIIAPLPAPGQWILAGYPGTNPFWPEPGFYAVVEDAVITSPLDVHDVAVTNVTSAKSVIGQNYTGNVTVTIENQGSFTETFDVTLRANTTVIEDIETKVVMVESGNSTTITFVWNTTGWAMDNYTLSAYAWPVVGETDIGDNTFIDDIVIVTCAGDVDGDGFVFLEDLDIFGRAWYTSLGDPNYNPNCDFDDDGYVFLTDLDIFGRNWYKSCQP